MAVQNEKVLTSRTQSGPCSCGCAPCDEISCGLDCAVQPRYFCGQLLTDADLSAGVTWSQGKFRLSRRREGWGAVCGLDVTCGPQPGTVTVRPGYAVDCCGDDIVVCGDAILDINKLFQQPPKQCEPGQKQPSIELGKRIENGEELAVDIYIHYREEQIIPATTLGRAACGQAGECEYSRVKESYQLTGQMIRRGDEFSPWVLDPQELAANRWTNELKANFEPLSRELEQYRRESRLPAERIQPILRHWLHAHPLYQFCWLDEFLNSDNPNEWLEEHRRKNDKNPALAEIVFLIVQDGINRFLARTCSNCEDEGVLLARVWLRAGVSLGKTQYEVQQIVSLPPYRREQQPDMLPAPLGKINVGEVIWRQPEDAKAILARYGISLKRANNPITIANFDMVFNRFEYFRDAPFLNPGGNYQPIVYRDRYDVIHLIGMQDERP